MPAGPSFVGIVAQVSACQLLDISSQVIINRFVSGEWMPTDPKGTGMAGATITSHSDFALSVDQTGGGTKGLSERCCWGWAEFLQRAQTR